MINNLREIIAPFFVGPGGQPLSPEEIARRREVAGSLLGKATDTSPTAGGSASVLAKAIQGLSYGINTGRANRAAQANNEASQANISAMLGLGGSTGGGSAFPPAPSAGAIAALTAPTDTASARVAQAHNVGGTGSFGGDLRGGIIETANALGIDPADLATAISYETGGTFDPTKRGPTTQWGQHRGLIQFGEPQAREHGVNWEDPIGSQLGPNGAVASYLRKAGVQPGMGLLDVYSAINAGAPGLYNRSDANNGGAPGTVRDKVERQMAGHRQKALALLGDYQNAGIAANEAMAAGGLEGGLTPDALTSWAEQNYAPGAVTQSPLAPIDVGVAETEEDILAQEAAMAAQDPSSFIGGVPVAETEADILAQEALLWRDPAFSLEMSNPAHVGVAETEEDILAQEALLSGDPAFSLAVEGEQVAPPIAPEPVLGMEPEILPANGRPMLRNPDGSVSTEESITITDPRINNGAPTNIPSIWGGRRTSNEDEAIEEALRSGQKFEAFPSIEVAVKAAQDRSNALGDSIPVTPSRGAIQALTGAQVNEALPMAGGANNVAPTINAAPSNPMAGLNPAVAQALVNPNASPQERAIAQSLLQQHMAQNQALQAQAQEAAQRAQTLAQRRGLAGQLGVNPDFAGDESIWKAATEASFRDAPSRAAGSYIQNRDGTFTQVPEARTGDIQEYEYARQNGYQGSFTDYQQETRRASAAQTNIDLGGKKFEEEFAKLDAAALAEVSTAGMSAQRNIGRINQLESLLAAAPSGAEARFKQMAGEWGIPTDGVSEIQAAQAMINSLVPEQRPAGSGPMSDADLELFKQSLPRVVNQPGGNAMIIKTMRAIAEYDAQGAAIVQAVRAGDITQNQAFQMLNERQNPLEGFKAPAAQQGGGSTQPSQDGWTTLPGGIKIRPKGAN